MKKYISLLSLVVIAIGWTACSETSNGPGCRIKGYLSFKEYKKVYLTDNSENRIDSCEVKDGRFYLEEKGNISEPYVAIIHMTAEQDSTDQLDMPVAFRWLPSHRNRLLKHHKFRLTMLAQYLPMKRRRCRK